MKLLESYISELGLCQDTPQRIEHRYGQIQRRKTDNTLFLESQLFKNEVLAHLYKI